MKLKKTNDAPIINMDTVLQNQTDFILFPLTFNENQCPTEITDLSLSLSLNGSHVCELFFNIHVFSKHRKVWLRVI